MSMYYCHVLCHNYHLRNIQTGVSLNQNSKRSTAEGKAEFIWSCVISEQTISFSTQPEAGSLKPKLVLLPERWMDHLRISLIFWCCLSFIVKVHTDLVRCLVGFFPPPCCRFIWIPLASKVKHMKLHLNIRKHGFTEWELLNTDTGDPRRLSAFPGVSQSLAGHNPG